MYREGIEAAANERANSERAERRATFFLKTTASTYKLAIARDDSVHHVLPIPLSVE